MKNHERDPFRTVVAFAPLVFAAHFAEEIPGFVNWFNSQVARGMTDESFWQMNIAVLVITAIVAALVWINHSAAMGTAAVVWLSFMMGANALVHIAAAIAQRQYVPGLATASIAYVPYFSLVLVYAKRRGVSRAGLLAAVALGALPMLVQGYLVIFRGNRLF
ncbi:MAG TPA: HXXEE domain-containing protein [Gemmatimonadaceae bacterium]|nr:HXXEE domain-containing protein [Gemmatimonadaceae bacterium]